MDMVLKSKPTHQEIQECMGHKCNLNRVTACHRALVRLQVMGHMQVEASSSLIPPVHMEQLKVQVLVPLEDTVVQVYQHPLEPLIKRRNQDRFVQIFDLREFISSRHLRDHLAELKILTLGCRFSTYTYVPVFILSTSVSVLFSWPFVCQSLCPNVFKQLPICKCVSHLFVCEFSVKTSA